ncbi:hypothetical protein [Natrarchaeobius chitinivorans]|uniref:Uncharacterized protein n=1 Tax=Natrarchaeobius chitinivorans TaxID=1679083 RepID=A0A3N6M0I4_NATCH|nr:hypothetical protein [Natrarchaeobius chitinivorans]RQG95087.1 hypothetical protein EA473_09030 [Natrarchaeobius chitinivorans]
MNRRALLRAGAVGVVGATAGCLDAVSRITWSAGVGSLHRPGDVTIDDRDPSDDGGIAAILIDESETDRIAGTEAAPDFARETDFESYGLVVVQINRPAADAASLSFELGGPERAGLRGLSTVVDVEPWGDLPDSLADAEGLEYTVAQQFDRPNRFVPRSATITLQDPDGGRLGRLEAV